MRYSYASPSRSSPWARLARKSSPSKIPTSFVRRSCISFPLPSLVSSLKSGRSITPLSRCWLLSSASASRADDLVDPVADLLGPLKRDHVGEASPRRHRDVGELVVARVLVRDVLHEEQREHVVLVLGRVHSAAQLVAALPERGVEVGFAEGHGGWGGEGVAGWSGQSGLPGRPSGVKDGVGWWGGSGAVQPRPMASSSWNLDVMCTFH